MNDGPMMTKFVSKEKKRTSFLRSTPLAAALVIEWLASIHGFAFSKRFALCPSHLYPRYAGTRLDAVFA